MKRVIIMSEKEKEIERLIDHLKEYIIKAKEELNPSQLKKIRDKISDIENEIPKEETLEEETEWSWNEWLFKKAQKELRSDC